ncbi:MAG: signal recognition particle subunit [Caeruleum heppii]|nr:MAG: signal recognition particle subunit [Caeruleum heppii]
MSRHARIEEVSDSSSADSDPSDFDPADFDPTGPRTLSQRSPPPPNASSSATLTPSSRPTTNTAQYKTYQTIYPLYFDASRTRAQGRRVSRKGAVPNPLAREIVDVVAGLGLKAVLEPGKTHPRDWANPGRVRVRVKEEGRAVGGVKNKHHLYTLISARLAALPPTSRTTPLRLQLPNFPPYSAPETTNNKSDEADAPDGVPPPPAIPRGWKMNTILPLHSRALTGGGVSENFLREMMQEMGGGGGGGGMPGGIGGGGAVTEAGEGGAKRRERREKERAGKKAK